ncbi:signal peptidase I [Candidatus Peregrinibacteria bacterium]|nr:signal peptidase I [Candidatus Peregrinibacteria bacterium]
MSNFYLIWMLVGLMINVTPYMVEGDSMYPNLETGDVFLIDQRLGEIERGDVIVFSYDDEYYYVKRVIGLPGETVKIEDEQVFIRNEEGRYESLNEPYLAQAFDYGDERFFKVPEGEYFVMGDNRDSSRDSRYFTDPYIGSNLISGKYIWP